MENEEIKKELNALQKSERSNATCLGCGFVVVVLLLLLVIAILGKISGDL